jgi:hypothetical protein
MKTAGPGLFAIVHDHSQMDHRLAEQVIRQTLRKAHPECEVHTLGWKRGVDVKPEKDWLDFDMVYLLVPIEFADAVNRIALHEVKSSSPTTPLCLVAWKHMHGDADLPELLTIFADNRSNHYGWLVHGLNSLNADQFAMLCEAQFTGQPEASDYLKDVVVAGRVIQNYNLNLDAFIARKTFCDCTWRGLSIAAINHSRATPESFQAVAKQKHDALMAWCWNNGKVLVTFWKPRHKDNLNLKPVLESAGVEMLGPNQFACDLDTLKSIIQ